MPVRIVDIREATKPISSDIRNAYIDFSKMTSSLVAVESAYRSYLEFKETDPQTVTLSVDRAPSSSSPTHRIPLHTGAHAHTRHTGKEGRQAGRRFSHPTTQSPILPPCNAPRPPTHLSLSFSILSSLQASLRRLVAVVLVVVVV